MFACISIYFIFLFLFLSGCAYANKSEYQKFLLILAAQYWLLINWLLIKKSVPKNIYIFNFQSKLEYFTHWIYPLDLGMGLFEIRFSGIPMQRSCLRFRHSHYQNHCRSILTAMNNLEKTLRQLLSRLTAKIMLYLLADFLILGKGSNIANFKTFYQVTDLLKKTSLVIFALTGIISGKVSMLSNICKKLYVQPQEVFCEKRCS